MPPSACASGIKRQGSNQLQPTKLGQLPNLAVAGFCQRSRPTCLGRTCWREGLQNPPRSSRRRARSHYILLRLPTLARDQRQQAVGIAAFESVLALLCRQRANAGHMSGGSAPAPLQRGGDGVSSHGVLTTSTAGLLIPGVRTQAYSRSEGRSPIGSFDIDMAATNSECCRPLFMRSA